MNSPSLLIVEAMGPGNVSWPSAQAHRHLSQRICFSLQSSFLSPCFFRNLAGTSRTSRARELLGHRQPRKSSQGRPNNQAGASSSQDSDWDATGRRNASAPRRRAVEAPCTCSDRSAGTRIASRAKPITAMAIRIFGNCISKAARSQGSEVEFSALRKISSSVLKYD